ncbi:hypothetical protein BGP_0822 [Beggiatoa sp. PS]|nr:hypothetical protein BGP_0822 [Beggiatoa sp. PS]
MGRLGAIDLILHCNVHCNLKIWYLVNDSIFNIYLKTMDYN